MEIVASYLRRAKEARAAADLARSSALKGQFEAVAESWERLAQERAALLNLKGRLADDKPSSVA